MATKLGLWNRTLNKVAELKINGLGENSVNRRLLESIYDDDRKIVLEMHSWKFAKKIAVLAVTTAPAFGYDNAFQLPVDFIKMLEFNNTDPEYREKISFDVVDDEIHTNESEAKIAYTADITDASRFSGGFVEVLSTYMANNIVYTKTKDQGLMDRLDRKFDKALSSAKRADASNYNKPQVARSAFPNIAARFQGTRYL